MTATRLSMPLALAGALALLALAPAAQAKSAKLDGQLIGDATTAGAKVTAPILLSEKSARKMKLRSPLATLTTKAKAKLSAPDPYGDGVVKIAAGTLRAGDELAGKAKVKGKRKALMPKLKGKKLKVTERSSKFSVDELTDALVALYGQVGALGLRVDALESGFTTLRAQLETVVAKNSSLETQITNLLTQITDLEQTLDSLTNLVGTLPTAAQLQDALDDITALQNDLAALEALIPGLATDAELSALQTQIDGVQTQLNGVAADVLAICSAPALNVIGLGSCP